MATRSTQPGPGSAKRSGRPRFAISVPQFAADGEFDPAAQRSYLARAEDLGFDSAWTEEQVIGTKPNLGPIPALAYADGVRGHGQPVPARQREVPRFRTYGSSAKRRMIPIMGG